SARRGAISEGMNIPGLEIPSKAEIDAIVSERPVSADQSHDGDSASSSVARVSPVADWADRYRLTRRGPDMRDIGGSHTAAAETPLSPHTRSPHASPDTPPTTEPKSDKESGERQSTRLWNAAWLADNINWLAKDGEAGEIEIGLLEAQRLDLQKSYDSMFTDLGETGNQIDSLEKKIDRKKAQVKAARNEELELIRSTKRKLRHGLHWLEKKQMKLG
ncbi:MAG: hypothetical protein Q9180_007619, partial [Flavoplaca navasiana]